MSPMAITYVTLPIEYFPDPTKGKPVYNGSVYVGQPNLDPEIEANRISVTLRQQDGNEVVIPPEAQPLTTGAGGVILYEGAAVTVLAEGNYSIKVLDKFGAQVYYVENAFDGEPVTGDQVALVFDTVADLKSANFLSIGDLARTKGYYTAGDGGQATYLVAAAQAVDGYGDHLLANGNVALISREMGDLNAKQFGAVGDGVSDDRQQCQALLDRSGGIVFPVGTYRIGDSGTTVPYRQTQAIVGLSIPSNTSISMMPDATLTPIAGVAVVPLVANGESNINIVSANIKGDTSVATDSLAFGIYFYSCSNVSVEKASIENTYSNTLEVIACSDVSIGDVYSFTQSGLSIGGGPQFEDCDNVTAVSLTGSTFDDLVSVIAHGADVNQHNFVSVSGRSTHSRTFYIGQSQTATGQRTLRNITAFVNSKDSGLQNEAPAFSLFRNGYYQNINVTQVDHGSYIAARIQPYTGDLDGRLYGSSFNLTSYNAQNSGIEINQSGRSSNIIEHNRITATVVNPNSADLSIQNGLTIQGGDFWTIDANIDYRAGKTNAGAALAVGSASYAVTKSSITGVISGGDLNIDLVNAENVTMDGLSCFGTENANSTSINIRAACESVNIGSISRDGEIANSSPSTKILYNAAYRQVATVDTGASITEVDLMSYTLPANALGANGSIRIKASGRIFGGAGNKTLTFYWGATAHILHPSANNEGFWTADIIIAGQGSRAAQRLDISALYNGDVLIVLGVTDSESSSVDNVIKFTGQTDDAGDTVQQRIMVIELA
jgi:hypothetical protein